jgi:D-aminopeptidase
MLNIKNFLIIYMLIAGFFQYMDGQKLRVRDLGIKIGILPTGKNNSLTDIKGLKVGHHTLIIGDSVRTGVTAILPHDENIFQNKVPAAIYISNGFGKLMGYSQVHELGNIETPIILTNTLSVPTAADALIDYTFSFEENRNVRSVNAIVGETNDGRLNDIRARHIEKEHVLKAIKKARSTQVEEGNVGAGTGTVCFGFKGGIGSSSRVLPEEKGSWTVAALVQTNFGGVLEVNGAPVGEELKKYYMSNFFENSPDGSCMIVVVTDAPLSSRNLKRLAKRAMLGLAKTGGIVSNGSGDYVIAVSTAKNLRIKYKSNSQFEDKKVLRNSEMSALFLAVNEATEEAILNSLFMAEDMKGYNDSDVKALPIDQVKKILNKYRLINH